MYIIKLFIFLIGCNLIRFYYLYFLSYDYKDFLNVNSKNDNNILVNENLKLKNELNNYKNENQQLKIKINKLKNDNENLNNKLIKANKIISNLNNIQNNKQNNNNEINSLKGIIKMKDKEIEQLTIQLKNSENKEKFVDYNKILFVHFISSDQNINCPIKCLSTDTFAEVEEKLYQKYADYRNTNNNFVAKGKVVLRFKKISENGIQDGDKVQLLNI